MDLSDSLLVGKRPPTRSVSSADDFEPLLLIVPPRSRRSAGIFRNTSKGNGTRLKMVVRLSEERRLKQRTSYIFVLSKKIITICIVNTRIFMEYEEFHSLENELTERNVFWEV